MILPSYITTIHDCAFFKSESLVSVILQSSLKTIDDYAFNEYTYLYITNILPNATIGNNAFQGYTVLTITKQDLDPKSLRYSKTVLTIF